jgi:hypothetical protein
MYLMRRSLHFPPLPRLLFRQNQVQCLVVRLLYQPQTLLCFHYQQL